MEPVGIIMDTRTGEVLAEFDECSITRRLQRGTSMSIRIHSDGSVFMPDWLTDQRLLGVYIKHYEGRVFRAYCTSCDGSVGYNGVMTLNISLELINDSG